MSTWGRLLLLHATAPRAATSHALQHQLIVLACLLCACRMYACITATSVARMGGRQITLAHLADPGIFCALDPEVPRVIGLFLAFNLLDLLG